MSKGFFLRGLRGRQKCELSAQIPHVGQAKRRYQMDTRILQISVEE